MRRAFKINKDINKKYSSFLKGNMKQITQTFVGK